MHILLVDDEPISRSLLQFQLQQWGHVVEIAQNGEQAWELLQTDDFQILITDWLMPGMSGIDLIQKVRTSRRDSYLYVIVLTSKTEKEALVTSLSTGADDFLTKPIDPNELRARLQPSLRIIDLERRLAEHNRELEGRNRQLCATNEKTKLDLDAAAQIQRAFLPSLAQDIPNINSIWHYSPCNEVGGDMLNVVRLDDEHIGIYVLDVSGHGVQASLLAVAVCRCLSSHKDGSSVLWQRRSHSDAYALLSPAAAMEQLNNRFVTQALGDQYFTLVYGILNQRTGEFRYSLGGHPAPVHVPAGGYPVLLEGTGLPVGIVEAEYDEHSVQLGPGDRLFFYSDGVTECMNNAHEIFGDLRLLRTLFDTTEQSIGEILSETQRQIEDWRGDAPIHDDISMLALEFCPQECLVPKPDSLSKPNVEFLLPV